MSFLLLYLNHTPTSVLLSDNCTDFPLRSVMCFSVFTTLYICHLGCKSMLSAPLNFPDEIISLRSVATFFSILNFDSATEKSFYSLMQGRSVLTLRNSCRHVHLVEYPGRSYWHPPRRFRAGIFDFNTMTRSRLLCLRR